MILDIFIGSENANNIGLLRNIKMDQFNSTALVWLYYHVQYIDEVVHSTIGHMEAVCY